jgi:uncharacterized membrane protein YfcA
VTPDLPFAVLAGLTLAAFVAGTIDAFAGGGGLITVPALLAAGLPPHLALGTNKGQSVFGSAAALAAFTRARLVDPRRARWTFPLGFGGSLAGAWLLLHVPGSVLRPVVLALLVGVAVVLAVRPDLGGQTRPVSPRRAAAVSAAAALAIGAYDGFFGPGTGTFVILALVIGAGLPIQRATADAKVVNFASNLAAVLLFAVRGVVVWKVAVPMAVGQFLGGWVGARVAAGPNGARRVRQAMVAVVLALAARLAWDLTRG